MSRTVVIAGLEPASYPRHALHGEDQTWVEKNCYVDVCIEILHALRLDPHAMLSFTVAVDFENDQWTFFKPGHDELRAIYGLDLQELNVWRPLVEHATLHLGAGKLISTEADAFWLPDTAATDYRQKHTKTTIVLNDIDVERRRLGYFHNAGYHALEGEDFERLFRIGAPADPAFMPLYAELIRLDRLVPRPRAELVEIARENLRQHVRRVPDANPIARFGECFTIDLADIQRQGLSAYHLWAFSTIRQAGAAFELTAAHLRWLGDDFAAAADPFQTIGGAMRTLILKVARAVNSGRPLDASALFAEMAGAWQSGMDQLRRRLP